MAALHARRQAEVTRDGEEAEAAAAVAAEAMEAMRRRLEEARGAAAEGGAAKAAAAQAFAQLKAAQWGYQQELAALTVSVHCHTMHDAVYDT